MLFNRGDRAIYCGSADMTLEKYRGKRCRVERVSRNYWGDYVDLIVVKFSDGHTANIRSTDLEAIKFRHMVLSKKSKPRLYMTKGGARNYVKAHADSAIGVCSLVEEF